jgi:hypothetical protein
METLSLKLVFKIKNKLICFDHCSPVVFQLIVDSIAGFSLMFLGDPFLFLL